MTMLDRVAKAIFDTDGLIPMESAEALAVAAIKSMREPSAALRDRLSFEAGDEWQAGIDAILEGRA